MITFEDTDVCQVTNHGKKDITLGWNSRQYVIPAGKKKGVPIQAAIIAFGDPRALGNMRSWRNPISNEVGWVPDRAAEVRRLRLRYGIQDGPEGTFYAADGEIPEAVPYVTVEFMEDGDWVKLNTVLDDPDGEGAVVDGGGAVDIQTLQASLDKTQRQLALLIQQEAGDINLGPEDEIPTDNPTKAVVDAKATNKADTKPAK